MKQVCRWIALLACLAVSGCGSSHGGTSSSGAFEVVLSDERLEDAPGNQCAMEGNASNAGNLRAHVELAYDALDGNGAVIGTSTASFEVAPFSNFHFDRDHNSSPFGNGLSCSQISRFRRTRTDVTRA